MKKAAVNIHLVHTHKYFPMMHVRVRIYLVKMYVYLLEYFFVLKEI